MVVGEITEDKDVVVIGGGPGGYHAAIRAAGLGRRVTLIEKEELGGTCLNKGCIPSKIFTHFAQEYKKLGHLTEMGMEFMQTDLNMSLLQQYREKKVTQLRKGVEALCKANEIEIVKGTASFLSDSRIGVENGHEFSLFNFKQAIIAAGGEFHYEAGIQFDSERILKERDIFTLEEIPNELAVCGSDYISLEIASSFAALGCSVTLILPEELPFDSSITKELLRLFKKQKITVLKDCELQEVSRNESGVRTILKKENGETISIESSHFAVSGSVRPNVGNLGLDRLGIELTGDGFIKTDNLGRTSIDNLWAIGDVTEGPSLAVKAIKQGKAAAEAIAGRHPEVDLRHIPTVIQLTPPVAFTGLSESQAEEEGYAVSVSEFPVRANGYAGVTGASDGLVKIVSDKETDLILGIHMIGAGAVELIQTGVLGLEMAARDEDFSFPLYAHPGFGESLLEAVEAIKGASVHLPPRKKEPAGR
ncbi:dihydrolipoamide dehydrogenase [[Bacillus] enclensis]|uniref:Dihydrolipoamide dehydrogenase n=1 Tax=[Bacillus] enclensis TaxID=1402860 RepID=A0A0V8HGK7_9BACI|nr:FAD-dependent oxidoreductase [[Bacillus] enclensis]KSU61556.1 dihydrolipoamide dehydrogenase [[Bacillus] enclensis]OAT86195.1 dihydrolipoamide dehydrogenase [Bacillus sp. MKU004]SCC18908.1 dihydrolipoamide dehydrogenase [[Bacillus] enclensis]